MKAGYPARVEFLRKWTSHEVLVACEVFIFMLDSYSLSNVPECSDI